MRIRVMLILFLLCLPLSHALGISPGKRQFDFQPGGNFTVPVTIHNNEKNSFEAQIEVKGELAPYIILSDDSLRFDSDDGKKTFRYTLYLPKKMDAGSMQAQVQVAEVFNSSDGIQPTFMLASMVILEIPGRYLTSSMSFSGGNITVSVDNQGSEDVTDIDASLDIMVPDGRMVDSISQDPFFLDVKEKKVLEYPLSLDDGFYNFTSVISYDEVISEERQYLVGDDIFDLVSISIMEYNPELIALDLTLTNDANKPIEGFYAGLDIRGNQSYSLKDTFSQGTQRFRIYIDDLDVGSYDGMLSLYGPVVQRFNISMNLTEEEIAVFYDVGTTRKSYDAGFPYAYVLLILVVALLILVYIYGKKRER